MRTRAEEKLRGHVLLRSDGRWLLSTIDHVCCRGPAGQGNEPVQRPKQLFARTLALALCRPNKRVLR